MKVLFLNYEYPPLGGGASIATESILREWAKDPSIEAHLVTAAVGNAIEHIRVGGETYVHRLPIGKNPDRLHSQSPRDILVYLMRTIFFLWRFIRLESKKQSFDVTLAFFTVPCGFLAYLVKLVFGIPYVVSLRGADVPGFSEKYDTFYIFAKPLVRFLWHRAAVVVPNSTGLTDLAKKTAPSQSMRTIQNGVDTSAFCPGSEKRLAEPFIFLSTSRLTPRKGIHHLIEAFALAAGKTAKPIELHLIGEGEQKPVLEERVRALGIVDKVKFIGRVEHEQLAGYYQHSHVFVLPSKNEGMSNSALEALASGLPLLVSGTGGMQELVTDGVNGYFIDPSEPAFFAEKLVTLADQPDTVTAFGAESRCRAETRSWAAVAHNFRTTLEESCRK
ncbi:MAG: glycosyltransferase [Candidatus Moraniibacteriota bacterium]